MQKTLKHTLMNFGGLLLPAFVALVCIPLTVRGYGNERYGLLSLALNLLASFAFFDMGISLGTVKYVANAISHGREEELPGIVQSSFLMNLVIGMLFTVGLIIAGPAIVISVLNIPSSLQSEAVRMFSILALSIPLITTASTMRGVLEASERFDLSNAVKIPATSALFLLPALGGIFSLSIPVVIVLLVLTRLAVLAAYAMLAARQHPSILKRTRLFTRSTVRLLKYGGWVSISNLITPLLNHADKFLITRMLGVAVLPYFTVPFELVSRTAIIPYSLAITLFPRFSGFRKEEIAVSGEKLIQKAFRLLVVLYLPVTLALILFAPEILSLWLGATFSARGTISLQALTLAFLFNAFAYIPYTAVQGLGRPDLKAGLDAAEAVVCIAAVVLLIPVYGIAGAALSRILVSVIDLIALTWFAKRILGSSVRGLFPDGLPALMLMAFAFPLIALFVPASLPARIFSYVVLEGILLLSYLKFFYGQDADVIASVFDVLRKGRTDEG
jgi:O-antigen/teichoic acid export membrane protein